MPRKSFRSLAGGNVLLIILGLLIPFGAHGQGIFNPAGGSSVRSGPPHNAVNTKPADQAADEKKEKDKGLPLKPERKLEVTTDEGTWMSLDVSPDNKTIVFELLGNLYSMPIEGGDAKRITESGLAFNSQPRFSPDAKWIAFISDRDGGDNVWIAKPDGSAAKQITSDKGPEVHFVSPSWTPDSQYILVSKSTSSFPVFEIWMYHIEGGSGLQISKSKPGSFSEPETKVGVVASADGRYLYYATGNAGPMFGKLLFPLWHLTRFDRITGEEDPVLDERIGSFRPAISPDGNTLIYLTRHETKTGFRVRNLKTGDDRWLKYPVDRDDQESFSMRDLYPGYTFLRDGREIIYSNQGRFWRMNLSTGDERPIPFLAQVTIELGPKLDFPQRIDQGPVKARLIQSPVESPDAKTLAFSALTHLYVMDLPNGKARRLTSGESREFEPAWSPDGKWIAYVTWTPQGGHIWKVQATGGVPQQLTQAAGFYEMPAWSPDGERIVALRGSTHDHDAEDSDLWGGTNTDIVWIPGSGGEANVVLPARGAFGPHFTREKDRVYVSMRQALVSFRFDGSDRRTHLLIGSQGTLGPEAQIRISPDGQWVLVHTGNQLYLVAAPRVGGEPPTFDMSAPAVPAKRLTDIGADYFAWADDGRTITWSVGASFFRLPLDAVTFATAEDSETKGTGKGSSDANSPANEAQAKPQKFKEEEKGVTEIAVDLEFPRHTPEGTIVLRGATVITMKGDEVIRNADIVVEDNRIKSVGPRGAVPKGAKIFNLDGKTIAPGFVDTHAHWNEIRHGIMEIENWPFLANLAYGVTSGLDVQSNTNDVFAYEDLSDIGESIGLRAFSTGPGVFDNNNFQSVQDVKGVLTKYKKYYGTHNIKSYLVGDRRQREFMVEAAKDLEMMPTTEGGGDMKLDLTHVLDGFHANEHTLPLIPLYKDVVQLFAQSGTADTPTLIVNYGAPEGENFWFENTNVHDDVKLNHFTPQGVIERKTRRRAEWYRQDEYAFPQFAAQTAKILRAGGLIGIGSHGQLQGLGYHWELWMVASGGLTPLEALRCATLNGAKIIGRPQDIGSIEPGKLADLVIFDKSPLDDIHNSNTIHWVMKNGELFEGDTLDQIWPEQKKLAPLWFQAGDTDLAGTAVGGGNGRSSAH